MHRLYVGTFLGLLQSANKAYISKISQLQKSARAGIHNSYLFIVLLSHVVLCVQSETSRIGRVCLL